MKIVFKVLFFLFISGVLWGCDRARMETFSGNTMGTTWQVKCLLPPSVDREAMAGLLNARLGEVNRSLSIYIPDSGVSRFNALKAGEKMQPDFYLKRVLEAARRVHDLTEGALDPTVLPLVNLWGFGPEGYSEKIPGEEELARARSLVGFDRVIFYGDGRIGKEKDGVSLDLGAIAKGYGVDLLAEVLEGAGVKQYLVEIGGEVRVAGCRPDGSPWTLGITRPVPGATPADLVLRLETCKGCLATSGDYRNFFESGGRRFSHILDPVSGRPADTKIISASVRHESCMVADAFATAIPVMGMEKAQKMVLGLDGVEAFIIKEMEDGLAESWMSPGFMENLP
ncbi:thiamine biosynthesis lipoprotein [Desulfobotulus alkaliphilus]|uniref:FAD:protein FMN transferase n=1 Tax=Desulfobotulus alkaliphilus TaxID=622671 RepID=A0A562RYI8_9BACT|nr:FAD:protein FMN transferase [Desulfobotulus alkaliphilus]TWI74132.1 thiamine biosynthesis lipoprotein [Desulfobotulus alkaliphilus]